MAGCPEARTLQGAGTALREDFSSRESKHPVFMNSVSDRVKLRTNTFGKPASPTTVHDERLARHHRFATSIKPSSDTENPPNRNYKGSVIRFDQYNHFRITPLQL
jgi:hypothetical protein